MNEEIRKNEISDDELESVSGGLAVSAEPMCPAGGKAKPLWAPLRWIKARPNQTRKDPCLIYFAHFTPPALTFFPVNAIIFDDL